MTVSVVIPAYNAAQTLALCLNALENQTVPATEIIVVDDGSTDDTPQIARQFGVTCVQSSHGGPAVARNAGAKRATGDVVAFTDADCIPERDWIRKITEGFTAETIALGGSYAIANSRSLLARLVHEEIVDRHRTMKEDADFLGSFNVAYRRDTFNAVGGFNEDYRHASGEDNDLAYRLHDTGARLRFSRDMRVAHHHPERVWPYLRTQARHGFWRMKLYRDHRGRAGGDQYAGLADLGAPPTALLLACTAPMICLLAIPDLYRPWMGIGWAAIALAYLASRVVLPVRIVLRTGNVENLALIPLLMVRDLARAIGLTYGVWYFGVRGKSTV